MLTTAITTFVTCLVLFVAVAFVVRTERIKGRRLCMVQARTWLDVKVFACEQFVAGGWHHFTQYVVRLGWYYSIHSLLRTILRLLVSVYSYFEEMFENNRERTKELRSKRRRALAQSHFTKIASHKAEVALTPEEKERRRHDTLEHNH
jgi:hypothetical protein